MIPYLFYRSLLMYKFEPDRALIDICHVVCKCMFHSTRAARALSGIPKKAPL